MIIPMIIFDLVSAIKSNGFNFNLIIKSEEDSGEPFMMGTMALEEAGQLLNQEMRKRAPSTEPPADVLRAAVTNSSRSLSGESEGNTAILDTGMREDLLPSLHDEGQDEMVFEDDQGLPANQTRPTEPQGQHDSDSDFLSPPRAGAAGPSKVPRNKMTLHNDLPDLSTPFMELTDSKKRSFAVKILRSVMPLHQKLGEKVNMVVGPGLMRLFIIRLQKLRIWTRRININNLTITQKYLKDTNYSGHDIALADIISWKGFKGAKTFASPPAGVSFKVKLSYNKFLQIFCEMILHFNGRNLSTYHRALTINRQPAASITQSLETTPDRSPPVPPALLSPMSPQDNPPRTPETESRQAGRESEESEESRVTLSMILNSPTAPVPVPAPVPVNTVPAPVPVITAPAPAPVNTVSLEPFLSGAIFSTDFSSNKHFLLYNSTF